MIFLVSSVHASGQFDIEKTMFNRHLKEYACKLIYPSLRHEKPELAKYDMSNLKAKIILDLNQNSRNYSYLKEFMNENPDFTKGLDYFVEIIHEKQKFEALQNNKFDFHKTEELTNYNASSGEKPFVGLGEWILFKYSFNLPPEKFDFINPNNKYIKTSKGVNEECSIILSDYRNITDKDTLIKLGPSIIERSEKLLTGEDDNLYESNAQDLYVAAGNCRVGLDLDLSTTPREVVAKYYVDYIKRIYVRVKVPHYKYNSLFAVIQMLESVQKYDDLLEYALNVKKDVYVQLQNMLQVRLSILICRLVVEKCPNKPEYFNVGKTNYKDLLIGIDEMDGYGLEEKRMLKLYFQMTLSAELYEKYLLHNEAVNDLDIVIASPPPVIPSKKGAAEDWADFHKDLIKQATTRRDQIIPMVDIKIEFVGSESNTVKKVYANYKNQDKNLCEFAMKLTTKTGNVIPKSFSIVLSYDDQVDKDFADVKTFFDKYKIDSLRGEKYGFINGNETFKTIAINDINENVIKFTFKYTNFSGDLFKIKAKAIAPYNLECSTQIQVWKQFTLKLYGMKGPDGKNLYPKTEFMEGRFQSCFVEYLIENHEKVEIPYHKEVFVGTPEDVTAGAFGIVNFIKETEDKIKYIDQVDFVNVIGCYEVTVKDTIFNSNDSGYGFYFRCFSDQLGPTFSNKFFNTALIAYSKFRDKEGKTLAHELGHSFGLKHPGAQLMPYDHGNNCIMQGGVEFPEATFCQNCIWAIRNSYVNSTELDLGPRKRKKEQ